MRLVTVAARRRTAREDSRIMFAKGRLYASLTAALGLVAALSLNGCIADRATADQQGAGGAAEDSVSANTDASSATDSGLDDVAEDTGASSSGGSSGASSSSGSSGASGSSGGVAKGCKADSDCADAVKGFPCKTASCDTKTGICQYPNAKDGASCGDGDKCTKSLLCKAGKCVKTFVQCDDNKPCTADTCDPAVGCAHKAASGIPCNDGNKCTANDGCVDGACKGIPKVCKSSDKCTKSLCDESSGACKDVAVEIATGATVTCDDGAACTVGDHCSKGACKAGKPKVCDDTDKNPCTLEGCQPADDPKGTFKAGDCVGLPAGLLGKITCDDGDNCTKDDNCGSGTCAGTEDKCDDKNPCTKDSCDKEKGCQNLADDTAKCDDGDSCTSKDTCAAGKCAGTKTVCNDGNSCTKDECVPGYGCIFTGDTSQKCEDGQLCTLGDTCTKLGACKAGSEQKKCDDGNACTTDSCSNATGCTHVEKPSGSKSACGTGGQCWYGKCVVPKCSNFSCEWGEAGKCDKDCPTGGGLCKVTDSDCLAKCEAERCSESAKACKDDAACGKLRTCVAACKAGDFTCKAGCVNAASNTTFVAFHAFHYCLTSRCHQNAWWGINCPQGPAQPACVKSCRSGFCFKEETLCLADAKCKALAACEEKCLEGDSAKYPACYKACPNYSDKATFALHDAMVQCTNKKCQLL